MLAYIYLNLHKLPSAHIKKWKYVRRIVMYGLFLWNM